MYRVMYGKAGARLKGASAPVWLAYGAITVGIGVVLIALGIVRLVSG